MGLTSIETSSRQICELFKKHRHKILEDVYLFMDLRGERERCAIRSVFKCQLLSSKIMHKNSLFLEWKGKCLEMKAIGKISFSGRGDFVRVCRIIGSLFFFWCYARAFKAVVLYGTSPRDSSFKSKLKRPKCHPGCHFAFTSNGYIKLFHLPLSCISIIHWGN